MSPHWTWEYDGTVKPSTHCLFCLTLNSNQYRKRKSYYGEMTRQVPPVGAAETEDTQITASYVQSLIRKNTADIRISCRHPRVFHRGWTWAWGSTRPGGPVKSIIIAAYRGDYLEEVRGKNGYDNGTR